MLFLAGLSLFYIDFAVARGLPFVGSRSLAAQNFVHAYRVSFEQCRNLRSKTTFQLAENVLYIIRKRKCARVRADADEA